MREQYLSEVNVATEMTVAGRILGSLRSDESKLNRLDGRCSRQSRNCVNVISSDGLVWKFMGDIARSRVMAMMALAQELNGVVDLEFSDGQRS